MNNEHTQNIKPFIFTKKINNKYKVIPLNIITNTSGPIRHFPPATKEWFNSIYVFNKNSIKNLSIADKNLIRLIKSYFNFYFNNSILKSKRITTRFRRLVVNIIDVCENDSVIDKYYETIYKNFLYKTHLDKEINIIAYYKLLLNLNKYKFENKFLSKLNPLIARFYNKEVEFNIVNLKTLYLNSDIFTEAISLKLKNRNNRLLQVLRSSLSMVKLPKVNRIREQYSKINIKEL